MQIHLRSVLAIGVSATFLVLGSGVFWVTPDTSDLNRNPAQWPKLSTRGLSSARYFSDVSLYLKDRISFRAILKMVDARIDDGVFQDSPSPRVIRGQSGWLYLRDSIDLPAAPSASPKRVLDAWDSLLEAARRQDLTVRIAIAPNKASIYPDYLPRREAQRNAIVAAHAETIRAAIRGRSEPEILDLWSVLQTARAANPKAILYDPRDTHWNGAGAAIAARAMVDSIRPGLWSGAVLAARQSRARIKDLDLIGGTQFASDDQLVSVVRQNVRASTIQEAGGLSIYRAAAEGGAADLLPKAVIVHDSFGRLLKTLLPPFFAEIAFVDENDVQSEAARRTMEGARILIVLKVERNTYRSRWSFPGHSGQR